MARPYKKPEYKVGRPTKYRPIFCERIQELGKDGKLPVHVATEFAVSKATIHQWREDYPEFSDAYDVYKELCEQWWIDLATEQAATDHPGKANMTQFMLARAFNYHEKKEVKTDVTSGGQPMAPIINIIAPDEE
jgi:transposase